MHYFRHKVDARNYLSTWFCGVDYRLIRRDNVAELIAYGFYYKSRCHADGGWLLGARLGGYQRPRTWGSTHPGARLCRPACSCSAARRTTKRAAL